MKHTIQKIGTIEGLSLLIHAPVPQLLGLIQYPLYKGFSIPKKAGGYRKILAPAADLKMVQSSLAVELQKLYVPPFSAFGFLHNREDEEKSIRANAQLHVGKKYLWNIDIKDFFGSISTQKIKDTLMAPPYLLKEQIAIDIALLCCYQRQLPAGAPSSPILSHIACKELDEELLRLIKSQSTAIQVSRYADDLSFSSHEEITESFQVNVIQLLKKHGFEVNTKKNRMAKFNQSKWVTGIKVNEKLNLDRRYIRNIRAILNDIEQRGYQAANCRYCEIIHEEEQADKLLHHLIGKINHVGFIRGKHDALYLKMKVRLSQIIHQL
ncbi:MAG: reverse transcriptase family protein [Bacteroidia bacterium]